MRPLLLGLVLFAALAVPASAADPGTTLLLDRPGGGAALPLDSVGSSGLARIDAVSTDGRYVVFDSGSDGLLPEGADKTQRHTFVRDRTAGTTTLVGASDAGVAGNEGSINPVISGNGRYVAFMSTSTNLTADIVGGTNVFVKDLQNGSVELASRRTGVAGPPDNGFVRDASISGDGQVVAWDTNAQLDNVADTNLVNDVYARNLATDTTTLISRADGAGGAVGTAGSGEASVANNGTLFAFTTNSALDPVKDTNNQSDVYVRVGTTTFLASRLTGANTSAGTGGSFAPSVDANGDYVAFSSNADDLIGAGNDTNASSDVFIRDVGADTTTLISRPDGSASSQGNSGSFGAEINTSGTRVGFSSTSDSLVPGVLALPFGGSRSYVRVIATNTTTLVSRATGASGDPAGGDTSQPRLSGSGTVAVFTGDVGNLGGSGPDVSSVYARDTVSGTTEHLDKPTGDVTPPAATTSAFASSGQAVSDDGRFAVFTSGADGLAADDDDRYNNAYLRDVATGALTVVSKGVEGSAEFAVISGDGTKVAFVTFGSGLGPPGAYVYDVATGALTLASRADGPNGTPAPEGEFQISFSGDGRRLAFDTSAALDPVHDPGAGSDVYVRDLVAQTTVLVSRINGADTNRGNGQSFQPSIDRTGNRVAFSSTSSDLGDGDATNVTDVHVRDLAANTTTLVSRANGEGTPSGDDESHSAAISADGNRVAFASEATNLGDGDATPSQDVHLRDLAASTTTLVSQAGGTVGDQRSSDPDLSADGTTVLFETEADNLVGAGGSKVVAHTLATGANVLVNRADGVDGAPAPSAFAGSIAVDGSCATFNSNGTGIVPGGYPSPDYTHIYLRVLKRECPLIPPDTTLTPGAGGSFSFTSTEDGSTFECRVNEVAFAPCTPPVTPAGSGTFAVRAIDKVGLVDPTPATAPFGAAAEDKVAPVLSKVSLSRKRFRAGPKGTPVTVAAKRGTTLRFTLSEAATVRIGVQRAGKGRRKGGKCVKPTKALRRAKRCTRFAAVRTLTRKGAAGANRVAFSGRIGKRKLKRGKYRMALRATDAAGNRSAVRRVGFRIVRR